MFMDYAKFLLPISIFAFKFLEWWYSENTLVVPNMPVPPPPEPLKVQNPFTIHTILGFR
jgi:peroxin-12